MGCFTLDLLCTHPLWHCKQVCNKLKQDVITLVFPSAAGLSSNVSIPIMAAVATTYTALHNISQGGMKAVIWTDVFQSGIMLSGIVAVLTKGCMEVEGISEAFHYAQLEGRLVGLSLSVDPRERLTVWGLVIGWSLNYAFIYGLEQSSMQRYSATKSLKDARL
ncbi:hypothetical protein CAPTEDRAFT_212343 [Capitella teleta]|uniref:Uncharacterized protein n=1 Tax=Capitella teleta TaxID=283909 RepID=R7VHJ9_CAPTE|nr:hypothetical protein CAPTEDRAFT_212343 [Capitella teleta]|eukprot:ELU18313.1 hypothetical protein CAPTEDRAFT_212343 [Capitella teleta]